MKAASLVAGAAFIVIFVALWFFTSPQVSLGVAALGAVLVGLAQFLVTRFQAAISQEQLSIMQRQEERDLQRSQREVPDVKASVEFRAKSELQPRGIHAEASYNALVTLENHGIGTAQGLTLTASREQGEALVRKVGLIKGGDTKFVVLPLELGPSIEATVATAGRTIVIEYEGETSAIVFEMTRTHPPAWGLKTLRA